MIHHADEPSPRAPAPVLVATLLLGFALGGPGLGPAPAEAGVDRWTDAGPEGGAVVRLVVGPAAPATVYAAGPGLFVSHDGGRLWQRLRGGLPDQTVIADLALAPGTAGSPALWALSQAFAVDDNYGVSFPDDRVYRSEDGGATWSPSGEGLLPTLLCGLAELSTQPAAALVVGTGGVYRSLDGGASWQGVHELGPFSCDYFGRHRSRFVLDPHDPRVAYLSGGGPSGFSLVTRDGGATWTELAPLPDDSGVGPAVVAVSPADPDELYAFGRYVDQLWRSSDGGSGFDLYRSRDAGQRATFAGAPALALGGGRFEVRAAWFDGAGGAHPARPAPVTPEGGAFWFFRPDNLELVAKLLDGGAVNGYRWAFTGALTHLGHEITFVDTATGLDATLAHPGGQPASGADLRAIPVLPSAAAEGLLAEELPDGLLPEALVGGPPAQGPAGRSTVEQAGAWEVSAAPAPGSSPDCFDWEFGLCLLDRFDVQVNWLDESGSTFAARAIPVTGEAGVFRFVGPDNLEVAVKVLDGRAVNGHFWVFWGGMTGRAFTVRVVDTVGPGVRSYDNPAGVPASGADLGAFD